MMLSTVSGNGTEAARIWKVPAATTARVTATADRADICMKSSGNGPVIIQLVEPNTPASRLTSSYFFFLMESQEMRVQYLGYSLRAIVMTGAVALASGSAFAQTGQF